jgi:tetratricopeptide (TPR) repeat protein
MNFSMLLSTDFWLNFYEQHRTYIIGCCCAIALAVGGGIYLRMSRAQQHELAQAALAEMLQEASRAQQNTELWSEVEVAARTGHYQYKSTSFAPYFLSLQADALAQQGKIDEAVVVMSSMLDELPKKSPLYHVYAIKKARMMLDSAQESMRAQGLELLAGLAQNTANAQQDEALYYLGMHYMSQGNKSEAKNSFQKLMDTFGAKQSDYRSPWLSMAQIALQQELA